MNERVYNNPVERLRSPERRERLEVNRVIEIILGNSNIKTFLDVGTGSALFAEEFFIKGIQVSGVDISSEMINAAKKFLPEVNFYEAPAEALPFNNSSFDVVFFGLVLHETDDYLKALREARRIAVQSVYVLEWYYRIEESGPPLEHRLKPEFIRNLSSNAGFSNCESFQLKNLVLYKLT